MTSRVTPALGAFFACVILAVPAAAGGENSPGRLLEIEDTEAVAELKGAPVVSPDGEWVAYTVCDPRAVTLNENGADGDRLVGGTSGAPTFTQGCDVRVRSAAGSAEQSATTGIGNNWGPVWGPDSKRLVYYSDRDGAPRLWLWIRDETGPRRLSQHTTQTVWPYELPAWTADGTGVVAHFRPDGVDQSVSGGTGGSGLPGGAGVGPPKPVQFLNGGKFRPEAVERAEGVTVEVFRSQAPPEAPGRSGAGEGATIIPFPVSSPIGSRALGVADVETGRVRVLVTELQTGRWEIAPDGESAAVLEIAGVRAKDYKILVDLVTYDIASGSRRVLASHLTLGHPHDLTWSPDGRRIAYLTCNVGIPDLECNGNLWVVDVANPVPRRFVGAPDDAFGHRDGRPRWSAGGDALYLTSEHQLWRGDADSGELVPVLEHVRHTLHGVVSASDERSVGGPDERSLYVVTEEPGARRYGIAAVDLADGTLTPLHEEQAEIASPVAVLGGTRIAAVRSSAHRPRDIWIYGGSTGGAPQRLTTVAPELEKVRLGRSRTISYETRDGEPLSAALLLPADYESGRRYPLMVSVYASFMQSEQVNAFGIGGGYNYNYQMLASRGWAVLKPDMPVNPGTPMKDVVETVLPAVDRAIEMGIADPERLAVTGQSNGGFSTLAVITQTERFKAAIAESAYADMAHLYVVSKPFLLNPHGGAMGTPLWEDPQRFVRNSPFYKLDQVSTPLMLYAGTEDRTFAVQSDAVYAALADLGKEVSYLRYTDESHALLTVANKVDNWSRVWAFLSKHVAETEQEDGQ